MNASKPMPDSEEEDMEEDIEEAMPAKKLTLGNRAKGFRLFKTAFDFFSNLDPSVIRALKLKQMIEEGLVPCRNVFRDMKKRTYDRKHSVFL